MATAYQAVRIFGNPLIGSVLTKSSFDISNFTNGKPMTIYIELPVFRLPFHKILIQLWINSLLMLGNSNALNCRTQFIIENPFSSEIFPVLYSAQHSDFAKIWTFWDSLEQLWGRYPIEWSAFLANSHKVEVLGPQSPVAAAELASVFGHPQKTIQSLKQGQSMSLYEYNLE